MTKPAAGACAQCLETLRTAPAIRSPSTYDRFATLLCSWLGQTAMPAVKKVRILIMSKSSDHSHTRSSYWKWLIGKITSPAILFFATSGQRRDLPSPFAGKTPMFSNLQVPSGSNTSSMTGSSSRGKRSPRQPRLQEPGPRHLWMRDCDSSTPCECQTACAPQARQRGRNLRTPSSRAKARALQPRHPGQHLLRTEELVQVPHLRGAKATNAQTLSRGHRTHGARALGGDKPILHLGAHLGAFYALLSFAGFAVPPPFYR